MEVHELRRSAREYIQGVTTSNQQPLTVPQTPLLDHGQPVSLASLVENLCISDEEVDRSQLFEKFVVLKTYFAGTPDSGSNDADRDSVRQLSRWVADAILPSDAFAERSPYAIDEKPVLTPDTIAREQALYSAGVSFLSLLLNTVHLDQDESTTVAISTCLASFSDTNDPWTTSSTHEQATSLIQNHLPPAHLPPLLHALLHQRVKPLFATSRPTTITPAARKAISPLPTSSNQSASDFDPSSKPWKYRAPYILTVFRWILDHLSATTLEENWPLLIPPLLTLLDDSSTLLKTRGCTLLTVFLTKCPSPLLHRTGLGDVFESALLPLLMYLPSLTPEAESIPLITAAFAALVELARVRFPDEGQKGGKMQALDRILREGVLREYAHAGEFVRVAEVLVRQIGVLVDEMGVQSAKHLKHILPLLSSNLANPFATAYPPLLKASVEALEAVMVNVWPRVAYHRGGILRGLTVCWCRIKDEEVISMELKKVQESVRRAVRILTAVLERDVDVKEEYQVLIDSDERLRELLIV